MKEYADDIYHDMIYSSWRTQDCKSLRSNCLSRQLILSPYIPTAGHLILTPYILSRKPFAGKPLRNNSFEPPSYQLLATWCWNPIYKPLLTQYKQTAGHLILNPAYELQTLEYEREIDLQVAEQEIVRVYEVRVRKTRVCAFVSEFACACLHRGEYRNYGHTDTHIQTCTHAYTHTYTCM